MNDFEERERMRLARVAQNEIDEAPVLEELRAAGLSVNSVSDLLNNNIYYCHVIDILISWLPKMTNSYIKASIVRALTIKWAKKEKNLGKLLVDEFEKPQVTYEGLRWAIGNAIEFHAGDHIADDMIRLVKSRQYGTARQMVVLGMGKLKKDQRVLDVLIGLLDDEDVAGHAVAAMRKLKNEKARPYLERFRDHSKAWIRREAKKGLENLDKARESDLMKELE